jgi:hypothetical protein
VDRGSKVEGAVLRVGAGLHLTPRVQHMELNRQAQDELYMVSDAAYASSMSMPASAAAAAAKRVVGSALHGSTMQFSTTGTARAMPRGSAKAAEAEAPAQEAPAAEASAEQAPAQETPAKEAAAKEADASEAAPAEKSTEEAAAMKEEPTAGEGSAAAAAAAQEVAAEDPGMYVEADNEVEGLLKARDTRLAEKRQAQEAKDLGKADKKGEKLLKSKMRPDELKAAAKEAIKTQKELVEVAAELAAAEAVVEKEASQKGVGVQEQIVTLGGGPMSEAAEAQQEAQQENDAAVEEVIAKVSPRLLTAVSSWRGWLKRDPKRTVKP